MKNRTRKQLLQVVINSLKKSHKSDRTNTGICGEINSLFYEDEITREELMILKGLIEKYKPTNRNKFKEFTEHPHFIVGGIWWWTRMQESEAGREQRILFLEKITEVI